MEIKKVVSSFIGEKNASKNKNEKNLQLEEERLPQKF